MTDEEKRFRDEYLKCLEISVSAFQAVGPSGINAIELTQMAYWLFQQMNILQPGSEFIQQNYEQLIDEYKKALDEIEVNDE